MKVLLLGGSGFVGGSIKKFLIKKKIKFSLVIIDSCNVNELRQMFENHQFKSEYYGLAVFITDFNIDYCPRNNVLIKWY